MSDTPTPAATDAQLTTTLNQILSSVAKASANAANDSVTSRATHAQVALLLSQAYARIAAPGAPQAALLPDTATSTEVHQVGLLNRG